MLAGFKEFLAQVAGNVALAYVDQLRIQTELRERLDKRLKIISRWKMAFAAFFLCGAAISAAALLVAINVKPRKLPGVVAASAASVLCIGVGSWIDSLLKGREKSVNKHRDIISAMTVAGRIGIGYLNTIHGFVGGLQSEAESILRLLDSDDEEADVRAKMAALKKRFRELRWEANRCSSAARSAEETVLLVINANLDRSSGASAAPPANASQTSYFHDDDVRDSQDLPEFVSDYLGSSFQDGDVFPALEDFLNGANFDLSFDQGARRVLATFGEFLAQVMMRLGYAYINQLGVQFGQDQHDKILDKRLKRNSRWKKSSAVLLLCGAAICAAVTANVKPKRLPVAAAATAASALFIGVAREIHLVLKRREKAMRNHRHIITAMIWPEESE